MRRYLLTLAALVIAGRDVEAQPATAMAAPPVFIDELTWMEIRDRMAAGTKSVIIGTAGQEQKGPHMVTGEHKYVLQHTAERIARTLGDALVAPIITYVPEGSWDTPLRGHMAKAGSITLPEDRFIDLLLHTAKSLRAGGFTTFILIGDSGGNQNGMKAAADQLNAAWQNTGARALFIGDYYTKSAADIRTYLSGLGFSLNDIGSHAGMVDTSELLFVNPALVRRDRLAPGGGSPDSCVNGDPTKATSALGKALVQIKIDNALAQIRASRANTGGF
jgi:creatinine amidohydrolase/Fe(II)-dependent formamide hydrolase-like protein